MEKERKNHKQEYFRKLRENAFLLEEIAELKKELTEAKKYRLPSVDMDAGSMVYKRRNSSMSSRSMSSGSSRLTLTNVQCKKNVKIISKNIPGNFMLEKISKHKKELTEAKHTGWPLLIRTHEVL